MEKLFGWKGQDKINYLEACNRIVTNTDEFLNFKRNPNYTPILEHVSPSLGEKYLKELNEESKSKIGDAYLINDAQGNPVTMKTDWGVVSPTTIRYLKVIQDLRELFDIGNVKTVVEIGAGYGGQARLILNMFSNIESYTCVDLLEPSMLQNKYNEDLPRFKSIPFSQNLPPINADLVISNYAFSELDKKIQDIYLNSVIDNCPIGYITYNPGAGWEYSIDEILVKLQNKKVKQISDLPMNSYYPNNRILYWS